LINIYLQQVYTNVHSFDAPHGKSDLLLDFLLSPQSHPNCFRPTNLTISIAPRHMGGAMLYQLQCALHAPSTCGAHCQLVQRCPAPLAWYVGVPIGNVPHNSQQETKPQTLQLRDQLLHYCAVLSCNSADKKNNSMNRTFVFLDWGLQGRPVSYCWHDQETDHEQTVHQHDNLAVLSPQY